MTDESGKQHEQRLQNAFVRIIEELNGLSAQDIALVITNVEKTIREQGSVSVPNVDASAFNSDLNPARSRS